jgi:hypothetical protein
MMPDTRLARVRARGELGRICGKRPSRRDEANAPSLSPRRHAASPESVRADLDRRSVTDPHIQPVQVHTNHLMKRAPDLDTSDAPFNRRPGDPPALTRAQVRDAIAFLDTLSDGYRGASR